MTMTEILHPILHTPSTLNLITEGQGRDLQSLKLKDYLQRLKTRTPKEKTAKTRIAEIVIPYLPGFNWQDETFFSDMTALWVHVYRYMKSHTEAQLKGILEWSVSKNIHPRGIMRVLTNKM